VTPALLLAAALAAPREAVPVRTFPYAVEGVIEADDNRDSSRNHYDAYRLRLSAGTRYRITVIPTGPPELMMMLELWEPGADMYLATHSSAGPEHPTPRLVFGPPATRDYVLHVLNLTAAHVRPPGRAYRLEIVPVPAAEVNALATPASTEPVAWRVWDSRFTAEDPVDAEGRRFHEYRLRLVAGQTRIAMAERHPGGDRGRETRESGVALTVRAADAPVDTAEALSFARGGLDTPAVAMLRTAQTGDYVLRVTGTPSARPEGYRVRIGE